jgi:hypothetical protein
VSAEKSSCFGFYISCIEVLDFFAETHLMEADSTVSGIKRNSKPSEPCCIRAHTQVMQTRVAGAAAPTSQLNC